MDIKRDGRAVTYGTFLYPFSYPALHTRLSEIVKLLTLPWSNHLIQGSNF